MSEGQGDEVFHLELPPIIDESDWALSSLAAYVVPDSVSRLIANDQIQLEQPPQVPAYLLTVKDRDLTNLK